MWIFIIIYIDPLLNDKDKYYPQVYFDNCGYKTVDKQMIPFYLKANRN